MAKNWIVVGDPTSSGGSVLTGSSFTGIDGLPVARVTDQATCPSHKGAFPIVDGDATILIDGQPVALHGSSLACGCKVLSAKQMRAFVEPGGGSGKAARPASAAQCAARTTNRSGSSAISPSSGLRQTQTGAVDGWKQVEVLRLLCPEEKAVVDQLAKTNVEVADEVYFDDPYFDGEEWTTKRFQAGGFQDPSGNRIVLLSQGSAQDAATTLYHETVHQMQPADIMWRERELDAYERTEAWTIERGFPGQGGLRAKGVDGEWIPDKNAIRQLVDQEYPIKSATPGGPVVIGRNAEGMAMLSDGTVRLPQKGDTYPAEQETMAGVRKIPSSAWKCTGMDEVQSDDENPT